MVFGAGVARRASSFFLLVQEKGTKKKDTPVGGLPLVDFLPLLAGPGAALKLARSAARPRAQTATHRLPPTRLRYSAPLRGPKTKTLDCINARISKRLRQNRECLPFGAPASRRVAQAVRGKSAGYCLSMTRVAGHASLSPPPGPASNAGKPEGPANGVPFFWVTFSWASKKR